ncbi:MAG: SurA N-terminal domain-containing protein [Candidatus Harrisonbacteria bacterium]|nr:SurA N-terminal domain-containing protein [Candidatus Harrisonbacteria bacterium]
MSFKNSLILFTVFIAVGLSSYFLVRNGDYPAAVVGFRVITAKEVDKNSFAAQKYLQNLTSISGSDPKELEKPEARREIRRAVLDKLISDLLVYNELNKRFPNEFQAIADNNIDKILENKSNLEAGIKALYGLNLLEFRERILLPQAYKEILEGRMLLANEKFDNWLKNKRDQASITILIPDLQWDGNSVKFR